MVRFALRGGFVSLLAIIGTGCVAKSSGTIERADSQAAGDALGNGIEDSAAAFGPLNVGATADAQCVTLGGDIADTDADHIPANATLTFDCTSMALGLTGALTGTESVVDDQPAAAAWAFTASANFHASLTGSLGASIVRDWNGQIVTTQASQAGPFALDRALDVVTVFTGANGGSTTVTEANDWTITYTPQLVFTPGGAIVTGTVSAAGTWDVTVGDKGANAALATPTPLTLTPSCATFVTAGTITGTYLGGGVTNTITVTWTACGQRTVTFAQAR